MMIRRLQYLLAFARQQSFRSQCVLSTAQFAPLRAVFVWRLLLLRNTVYLDL